MKKTLFTAVIATLTLGGIAYVNIRAQDAHKHDEHKHADHEDHKHDEPKQA